MNVIYQEPSDLVLQITDKYALLPSFFNIISYKEVLIDSVKVKFAIIGESHLISITGLKNNLHEILSCVDFDNILSLETFYFRDSTNYFYENKSKKYTCKVWITNEETIIDDNKDFIVYEFKNPLKNNFIPKTKISWDYDSNVKILKWRTLHTYNTIKGIKYVYSESNLNLSIY